jgi:hypothetical protein
MDPMKFKKCLGGIASGPIRGIAGIAGFGATGRGDDEPRGRQRLRWSRSPRACEAAGPAHKPTGTAARGRAGL